ncbi:MAG: NYN domain-containing protein [Candidatus Omnitrophica bacterium]|nr:NYN domain-containing protein [Candidatus Omnitrophota bacterium]
MFQPKTDRIKQLAKKLPRRIDELEKIFDKTTNIYIDFANVFRWQEKLKWHIDLKRLKQLLDSFDLIQNVKFYSGTLMGDSKSEQFIKEAKQTGYIVITKPVKIMRLSIDVSSITPDSPQILKQFIRAPLLQKMSIEAIEYLNARLKELNQQGILYIEDLKCNFDVEIGRDMLLDYHDNKIENFILWSGDSDFADPVRQLLSDNKKVVLFATARRVSVELNELRKDGLFIFDIQKIRDFICWKREMRP